MNKDENLDHDFLSLRAEEAEDRTFMGGMRLGARARLFVLTGLFALGAAAGLFVFADTRLSDALDNADGASRMAALAGQVELGVAKARGTEKAFLLAKDTALADVFQTHLTSVSVALERLARIPAAARQRKHMDTIRDGLAQYDEQFKKLVTSEKELGLKDDSGLSRELRNVTEDLQAKFSTAGYGNLAGQISRINQEGQETLLSGYKKGVEEIQKRYKTLIIFLKETKIPAKRKETLQTLLKQHETYLLAMINARFNLADETRQFDDLLSYLAPSINAIVGYSDRLSRGAAKDLIFMRTVSRAAIGGGLGRGLLFLVGGGLVVFPSLVSTPRGPGPRAGRVVRGRA
ncbi:MAG: hypothetical protein H8E39_06765 [Alphaproteobacteria bacterium]|nr:hypothetical protein [Alphaproteobacteria bacterium]